MALTEAAKKEKRQAAAKNASETTRARNTALIQFAIKQLQSKSKEVTAANVSKVAGMSEATARDYLQKMNLLSVRKVKTAQHKAAEKRLIELAQRHLENGIFVGLAFQSESGGNWKVEAAS